MSKSAAGLRYPHGALGGGFRVDLGAVVRDAGMAPVVGAAAGHARPLRAIERQRQWQRPQGALPDRHRREQRQGDDEGHLGTCWPLGREGILYRAAFGRQHGLGAKYRPRFHESRRRQAERPDAPQILAPRLAGSSPTEPAVSRCSTDIASFAALLSSATRSPTHARIQILLVMGGLGSNERGVVACTITCASNMSRWQLKTPGLRARQTAAAARGDSAAQARASSTSLLRRARSLRQESPAAAARRTDPLRHRRAPLLPGNQHPAVLGQAARRDAPRQRARTAADAPGRGADLG
mmetsp:Transcript_29806/g.104835  ORF Transcript_29806/g.104835 Transcript_29806/m.104835 type:complete len:295 (+) Transcript_29806:1118-2002(+)